MPDVVHVVLSFLQKVELQPRNLQNDYKIHIQDETLYV